MLANPASGHQMASSFGSVGVLFGRRFLQIARVSPGYLAATLTGLSATTDFIPNHFGKPKASSEEQCG